MPYSMGEKTWSTTASLNGGLIAPPPSGYLVPQLIHHIHQHRDSQFHQTHPPTTYSN